jgi:hypothetical protein
MTVVPPSFKFEGNIEKSKTFKTIGNKLYNSTIDLARLENINQKTLTKQLDDGSIVISTASKNSVYDNWSGVVNIVTEQGGQSIQEDDFISVEYYDIESSINYSLLAEMYLFLSTHPIITSTDKGYLSTKHVSRSPFAITKKKKITEFSVVPIDIKTNTKYWNSWGQRIGIGTLSGIPSDTVPFGFDRIPYGSFIQSSQSSWRNDTDKTYETISETTNMLASLSPTLTEYFLEYVRPRNKKVYLVQSKPSTQLVSHDFFENKLKLPNGTYFFDMYEITYKLDTRVVGSNTVFYFKLGLILHKKSATGKNYLDPSTTEITIFSDDTNLDSNTRNYQVIRLYEDICFNNNTLYIETNVFI